MKDLEIRGAGNLLGGEQSGHIAAVGFDLYVRLVGEAVADFKGEAPQRARRGQGRAARRRPPAARLHPRRAAAARGLSQAGVRRDRGGALRRSSPSSTTATASRPQPVTNLVEVARFRLHARTAGLSDVALAGRNVRFGPVDLRESQQMRLQAALPGLAGQAGRPYDPGADTVEAPIGGSPLRDVELLRWCRDVIDRVLIDATLASAAQQDQTCRRTRQMRDRDRDGELEPSPGRGTGCAAAWRLWWSPCSPPCRWPRADPISSAAAAVIDGTSDQRRHPAVLRARVPRDRAQRRSEHRCSSTSSRR